MDIAQKNRQNIEVKFAMLLMNTCRQLREKSINVKDFQMCLTACFSLECITKSCSIHEIFEVITHHKLWDYWNYYPLEKIVQGFAADDSEMISWIETYKRDLKSYKVTTKLIDHIAKSDYTSPLPPTELARYNPQYYQRLSLKLRIKFTDETLTYIDDLWNEFAELYNLPPYVALLDRIHKGCVLIVWFIPSQLVPQVRSTTPLSADFYRKHEIARVELGEECIYQEEEENRKVYVPVL